MKRLLPVLLSFFLIFCVAGVKGQNIFIKVYDQNNNVLQGQSVQAGYAAQTEAVSFGQESSACAFNTTSCTPVTGNFIFNMIPDILITDFRAALYFRRVWRKVEISFTKNNGGAGLITYQKITLQDVVVTGISESNDGVSPPVIQVKLDPKIVSWTFTVQNQLGQTLPPRTITYDRSTNTGTSN